MSDATVFCNQCGQPVNAAATFCTRCGGTLTPATVSGATVFVPGSTTSQYAGFWIRVVARVIDSLAINVVLVPIAVVIMFSVFATQRGAGQDSSRMLGPVFLVVLVLAWVILVVGLWLYEALMTSSSRQATLGKMAMNIKVTDDRGGRLTFARATGRYFAKMISGFTMGIGYIMAGFTERKQALHDMIAGTLVIRN